MKFNRDTSNTIKKPKVLVVPLDWGLGHATRCIPLIYNLLAQGYEVFLAGEGKIKALLIAEFPQLVIFTLKGYRVQYASKGWQLPFNLVRQLPKIAAAIKHEHNWLNTVIKKHNINIVISDNRYGLYHKEVPAIFLTHQLQIKAPVPFAERLLQFINYRYINRFSACWVPDYAELNNLAGLLSHPAKMPAVPVTYIGPLSRFSKSLLQPLNKHLLVLLSGPEPQRSILEKILLTQLTAYQKPVVFVRGLPGNVSLPNAPPFIAIHNHLPATTLQSIMEQAHTIISRCGYSTVMDITVMQKKSILIPTPGQTEQEYLALQLTGKRLALCLPQATFNLLQALELSSSFPYQFLYTPSTALEEAVNNLQPLISK